jgi:predicted ATPase
MRFIEKIEITKFRSLGERESFDVYDLNILSGGNDSGKSNILKALNLFFNNESDFNTRYISENDFNKWFRDNNIRGQRIIEIKVDFSKGNYRDRNGINNGFIAKKTFSADGGIESIFYNKNGEEFNRTSTSHRRANAVINEKFVYIYVPAIRDKRFRESIQRLIESIAQSSDRRFKSQDLKESFEKLESGIEDQLKELRSFVHSHMDIDLETTVNFGTLLESMTFETKEKIRVRKRGKKDPEIQRVSLSHRGEGIQMQFFSFLLWFISKNDKKHFYIWGYEEPEIAFEFQRQFELVELFRDLYSKVAQIFVTTHSPAFAFATTDSMTKVYRVSYQQDSKTKKERFISKVTPIDDYVHDLFQQYETTMGQEEKKSLERDIWGINAQKISRMLGKSIDELIGFRHVGEQELSTLHNAMRDLKVQKDSLSKVVAQVEVQLKDTFPEKVFICEDKKEVGLWEHLLFITMDIDKNSFQVISSKGCTVDDVEIALKHLQSKKDKYYPTVFRQLDRDGFNEEQVTYLESKKITKFKSFKKYNVKFLPVNELENFAIILDDFFTKEKLSDPTIRDKISDAFNATVNANLIAAQKLCKTQEERNIFNGQGHKLIQEARKDILRYFPGKDIKKLKPNFSPTTLIKKCEYNDLPEDLKQYLNAIKEFYST